MVIFNELRISDDKKHLIIDCHVEDLSVYSEMYISAITLYHYTNANSCALPVNEDKVVTVFDNPNNSKSTRAVRRCVNVSDIAATGASDFDGEMFFVKVECDGELPGTIALSPCGTDETVDIAIVLDWRMLYDKGMRHVAAFSGNCADRCDVPAGFQQFIMMWFALRLALESSDYVQLADIWGKLRKLRFVGSQSSTGYISDCNCR